MRHRPSRATSFLSGCPTCAGTISSSILAVRGGGGAPLPLAVRARIAFISSSAPILLRATDDFTAENAPALFEYVDALIAAFNSDPQQRFHAFYSTPSTYMGAKLATLPTLPVYAASPGGSADFFPYSDDPQGHNLWTGYFTSRPSFKHFVRVSSALQQAARQLQVLVGGVAGGTSDAACTGKADVWSWASSTAVGLVVSGAAVLAR